MDTILKLKGAPRLSDTMIKTQLWRLEPKGHKKPEDEGDPRNLKEGHSTDTERYEKLTWRHGDYCRKTNQG